MDEGSRKHQLHFRFNYWVTSAFNTIISMHMSSCWLPAPCLHFPLSLCLTLKLIYLTVLTFLIMLSAAAHSQKHFHRVNAGKVTALWGSAVEGTTSSNFGTKMCKRGVLISPIWNRKRHALCAQACTKCTNVRRYMQLLFMPLGRENEKEGDGGGSRGRSNSKEGPLWWH